MKDIFTFLGLLFFLIVVVGGSIFFGLARYMDYRCSNRAIAMGLEYSWSLSTDCMVKVNGKWLPLRNYRVIEH